MNTKTWLTVLAAAAAGVALGSCGGAATPAAQGDGQPTVRQNDYRLYEVPNGRTIVCIGWGRAGGGFEGDATSSALDCDWDHPVDR